MPKCLFTVRLNASINTHADAPCRNKGLNFGLKLNLHPYFLNVSSKYSGEAVNMHRLT